MRSVGISNRAEGDLLAIDAYIRRDSPSAAERMVLRLQTAALDLAETALQHQYLTGYEDRGWRRRVVPPYSIIYIVEGDHVEILHVVHGARDLDKLLEGRD